MKHLKLIALILILITATICLSSCQQSDSKRYEEKEKTAEALMLQHEYNEAALEMEELGDYDKAVQFARYCRGLEAGEKDDFETAVHIFETLGDYRDSIKMTSYYAGRLHESNAGKENNSRSEELLSAAKIYLENPGFRDSQARADACYQIVYSIAKEWSEQKEYDTAEQIYISLGDYLDSATLAKQAKADALFEAGDWIGASSIYSELQPKYQTHENEYHTQYEEANQLIGQGQYDEAKTVLTALGVYQDSQTLILDCDYLKASDFLQNGQYDDAEELFAGLYSYRDSSSMVFESRYRKAMELYEKQEYQNAADILNTVYYYKDSRFQIAKIQAEDLFKKGDLAGAWALYRDLGEEYQTYNKEYEAYYEAAGELLRQGMYDDARKQFVLLGTYRDSEQMAIQCQYDKAKQYKDSHYYTEALIIYEDLKDQDSINSCHYEYGQFLKENKEYPHAAKQFSLCRDYKDSREQSIECGMLAWQEGNLEAAVTILQDYKNNEEIKAALYKIAIEATEKKDYEVAIAAYDCSGDYPNARTERMKTYNLWTEQLLVQGEYDRYIEAVSALGDSEETAEKIRMAKYAKAKYLIGNESYYEARALLQSLEDYKDSRILMKNCNYMLAKQMYLQGQYQEALATFIGNQLEGYPEADEMITDCRYRLGLLSERTEEYRAAAEFFEVCGDYQDSREHWLNCCYQYAVQQTEAGETDEAILWFAKAREHLDAVRQMESIAESFDKANKPQEADHTRQLILWIRAENALDDAKYQLAADCFGQITDQTIAKDREKEAYYQYGEELLNNQEYAKAAAMFAAATDYLDAQEKYQAARISEGNEALETSDYPKARECFADAGDEERITAAWIAEAESKLRAGQYAEARKIYATIGMDKKIPEIWNYEAEARLSEGRYAEAKDAFRAAGNQSGYEDALLEEAKAHIAKKEYESAYELLTKIQEREEVQEILQAEQAFIPYRIHPGETIVIGTYEQDNNEKNGREPIEWIVLATNEDNHALVISRYGLDCRPYNLKNARVTWETCTLREWLNQDFYAIAFSEKEQRAILSTEIDNSSQQGNNTWGIGGGENTTDNIFLLSYQETDAYLPDIQDRICTPTAYATACGAYVKDAGTEDLQLSCWWWLRSPGSSLKRATRVGTNGSRAEDDVTQDSVCVRPVLWLDLVILN